jgi:hypothetical protein
MISATYKKVKSQLQNKSRGHVFRTASVNLQGQRDINLTLSAKGGTTQFSPLDVIFVCAMRFQSLPIYVC